MTAGGLEAVFLANRETLLRFLRARGAGDSAEDLLQDLWVRASAVQAGPIAEPLSYLYTTANNLMLDRHRSSSRAQRRDHDWTEAATTVPGVSDTPSAERVLVARDRLRRVQAALDAIGERPAAIFRRFRIDGVGQRDIATEFGISLSAVEKDLQKAYRVIVEIKTRDDADSG